MARQRNDVTNEMVNNSDQRDYNRYHDLVRDDFWGGSRSGGSNTANNPAIGNPGFAGLGPKGYKRSDTNIYEDVCQGLENAAAVDASDISVEVNDGVVYLGGVVTSKYMKRIAEDIAINLRGVKDVMNRLEVNERPSRQGEGAQ